MAPRSRWFSESRLSCEIGRCPNCGGVGEAGPDTTLPPPGSVACCPRCAVLLVVQSDMTFATLTAKALKAMPQERRLWVLTMRAAVRMRA